MISFGLSYVTLKTRRPKSFVTFIVVGSAVRYVPMAKSSSAVVHKKNLHESSLFIMAVVVVIAYLIGWIGISWCLLLLLSVRSLVYIYVCVYVTIIIIVVIGRYRLVCLFVFLETRRTAWLYISLFSVRISLYEELEV